MGNYLWPEEHAAHGRLACRKQTIHWASWQAAPRAALVTRCNGHLGWARGVNRRKAGRAAGRRPEAGLPGANVAHVRGNALQHGLRPGSRPGNPPRAVAPLALLPVRPLGIRGHAAPRGERPRPRRRSAMRHPHRGPSAFRPPNQQANAQVMVLRAPGVRAALRRGAPGRER